MSEGNDMTFQEQKHAKSGVWVITCPARIDVNVSDELRDLITQIIAGNEFKIVLDLSDTGYIDSSGLGAIVSRISVLRSNQGDVRLAATGRNILDLLELTQLNKIIRTFPDVIEAENSFES